MRSVLTRLVPARRCRPADRPRPWRSGVAGGARGGQPGGPFAAFVLAESLHTSGVTAVVVAAVLLGRSQTHHPAHPCAARRREREGDLRPREPWFSLIGLQLPMLIRSLAGTNTAWLLPSLAIAATLIATRVLCVFPLTAVAQRSPALDPVSGRVSSPLRTGALSSRMPACRPARGCRSVPTGPAVRPWPARTPAPRSFPGRGGRPASRARQLCSTSSRPRAARTAGRPGLGSALASARSFIDLPRAIR